MRIRTRKLFLYILFNEIVSQFGYVTFLRFIFYNRKSILRCRILHRDKLYFSFPEEQKNSVSNSCHIILDLQNRSRKTCIVGIRKDDSRLFMKVEILIILVNTCHWERSGYNLSELANTKMANGGTIDRAKNACQSCIQTFTCP